MRYWYLLFLLFLLAACEQRPATSEQPTPPTVRPDSSRPPAVAATAPGPTDTTDLSRVRGGYGAGRDTAFYLGRQRYQLRLRAAADSAKPLVTVSTGIVGGFFADDTSTFARTRRVRGYDGSYTISLLDPAGKQLFRRRLRKADLYGVVSRDVVTVSEPVAPRFIGCHAGSKTLVFALDVGIPYSDAWETCVIILGFDGQVRRLATSSATSFDGADCAPRLLADGAVLTCQEIWRPDGSARSLLRPKSQLVAAFALTDTTLCTVYRYREYRPRPEPAADEAAATAEPAVSAGFTDPEWVADKQRQYQPNAFVLDARGRTLSRFRYAGYSGTIGYAVPRRYVWPAHSYYLLDAQYGLYRLDKQNPAVVRALPFRTMQRFRRPRRATEIPFTLATETASFVFYLDPARPDSLRYERRRVTE